MNDRRIQHLLPGVVLSCVLLGIAAVTGFRMERATLTPAEARLVGNWSQFLLPGNHEVVPLTFSRNRDFRTRDGEFAGRWWIDNQRLHVRYWNNASSSLPLVDVLQEIRAETEVWEIAVDVENDRVEIGPPGKPPDSVLVRLDT